MTNCFLFSSKMSLRHRKSLQAMAFISKISLVTKNICLLCLRAPSSLFTKILIPGHLLIPGGISFIARLLAKKVQKGDVIAAKCQKGCNI